MCSRNIRKSQTTKPYKMWYSNEEIQQFFFLKCTLLFPSKEKNILETISGLKAVNVFRSLKNAHQIFFSYIFCCDSTIAYCKYDLGWFKLDVDNLRIQSVSLERIFRKKSFCTNIIIMTLVKFYQCFLHIDLKSNTMD